MSRVRADCSQTLFQCVEDIFSLICSPLLAAFLSAYADIALGNLLGTVSAHTPSHVCVCVCVWSIIAETSLSWKFEVCCTFDQSSPNIFFATPLPGRKDFCARQKKKKKNIHPVVQHCSVQFLADPSTSSKRNFKQRILLSLILFTFCQRKYETWIFQQVIFVQNFRQLYTKNNCLASRRPLIVFSK